VLFQRNDYKLSANAQKQMAKLLEEAKTASADLNPDGLSYMHVMNFIEKVGYGKIDVNAIPGEYSVYARQFAEYADKGLNALGLRKLDITNPYQAPAGALVVMRPGTPGTGHPTAGDISVAGGDGAFYSGGKMSYGKPADYPPGNRHVLGVYVPE
jgi:hypothetical protein